MVRVGGTKRFPLHNNNHNTERLLGTVRCSGSSVCVTHKSLTRPTLFYAHFPDEEGSSADSGWFEGQGNILCLLAHLSGWIQFFKHRLAPNNSFCLVMGLRKKLVGEDCYVFVSMGSDKYFVCIFHFSTLKKTNLVCLLLLCCCFTLKVTVATIKLEFQLHSTLRPPQSFRWKETAGWEEELALIPAWVDVPSRCGPAGRPYYICSNYKVTYLCSSSPASFRKPQLENGRAELNL